MHNMLIYNYGHTTDNLFNNCTEILWGLVRIYLEQYITQLEEEQLICTFETSQQNHGLGDLVTIHS